LLYNPYFIYFVYFCSQATLALCTTPEDIKWASDHGEYYLGYELESYDEPQSFEPTLSDVPKKHNVGLRFHGEEISSKTEVTESLEPVDIYEYYMQVKSYQDHIDSYINYVQEYTKLGLLSPR
jgi:hypothetical protein